MRDGHRPAGARQAQICAGLDVVEVGAGSVAASLAGMVLADYGARVVKLEPPDGDRLRLASPSGFLVWNRGKESKVLDLRHEPGREAAREIMARADVVIEGFAAGVADEWGIGADLLRGLNSRLVYCSIKGFGSSGPYAKLKAYDAVVAAKAGIFSLGPFGFRDGPIYCPAMWASHGAGHMAVGGILAALVARVRTGAGQAVEATLLQGLTPLDYYGVARLHYVRRIGQTTASVPAALGANRYNVIAPTKDGSWIIFSQMLSHQARALSRAVGVADCLDEPRLAGQPFFASAEDAQEWEDLIWRQLATRTYADWEPRLLAEPDIAFELARRGEEGLDHPQIRHNGDVIAIEDPELGEIRQVGPVAAFSRTPSRVLRSAPRLGECADRSDADSKTRTNAPRVSAGSPASGDQSIPPLSGVTILELGYFYAMPYALAMAAALGARVIKLESLQGDPFRRAAGPPEVGGAKSTEGKQSLAVDLRTTQGQQIVHRLVERADVFVNGFRVGAAERLRLDYETLASLNQRLVYFHCAGYGSSGPYARRPIYAQVASALAGGYHRFAGSWIDPMLTAGLSTAEAQALIHPRLRGLTDGDANAAVAVFSALLLGIFEQRRSGRGQFASTSLIGGNAWAYADDFTDYAGKPRVPQPDPENYGLHALYRLYRASPGWVFLAACTQSDFAALAGALREPGLLDPRFASEALRAENDEALVTVLGQVFATRDADEWEAELTGKGVACVKVFEGSFSEFTSDNPVLRQTGKVVEVEHPSLGKIPRTGPPVTMSQAATSCAPGCLVGQHTDLILAEIGLSQDEIAEFKEQRVVQSSVTRNGDETSR
jgi:crotonobetainyl-CoA:carnitine CoA-transferase CaiB-like acyl-CoA transferase